MQRAGRKQSHIRIRKAVCELVIAFSKSAILHRKVTRSVTA